MDDELEAVPAAPEAAADLPPVPDDSVIVTDPWEIPQTETTTDENGNTVVIGYPSDGAIPVEAPADTTSDGAPAPSPGSGDEEPQGA